MRAIKVRFWSPSLKAMSEPYAISELALGHTMPAGYPDGVALLYTGLKDFHEQELCEGDIVKVQDVRHGGLEHILIVKWDNGSFELFDQGSDTAYAHISYAANADKNGQILGNIYENEELLDA